MTHITYFILKNCNLLTVNYILRELRFSVVINVG